MITHILGPAKGITEASLIKVYLLLCELMNQLSDASIQVYPIIIFCDFCKMIFRRNMIYKYWLYVIICFFDSFYTKKRKKRKENAHWILGAMPDIGVVYKA